MRPVPSFIAPYLDDPNCELMRDCIVSRMHEADHVVITVIAVTEASLRELDSLLEDCPDIKRIELVLGKIPSDDTSEDVLRLARSLDVKWRVSGRGEIRVPVDFTYGPNMYYFYRGNKLRSCITYGADLSVLKPDPDAPLVYDVGYFWDENDDWLEQVPQTPEYLLSGPLSANISDERLVCRHRTPRSPLPSERGC